MCCSAEKLELGGSWIPCAVKRVLYNTREQILAVDQELATLKAVQGLPRLIQYIDHAMITIDAADYMYIATR